MLKEAALAKFQTLSWYLPHGTVEGHYRPIGTASMRTEIWIWDFSRYKLGIPAIYESCLVPVIKGHTWSDNKVCELTTVCLPWQHWTKALVWFDDVDISAFHSYVVDLWQSLSEWHLLLSACVLVCPHENVGAWIRATNEY